MMATMNANGPRLRPGRGSRILREGIGEMVSVSQGAGPWRHPWFTVPEWLPKSKRWVARVKAGFVNGFCPVVRTTTGLLGRGTFWGQLVDARTGAAQIEQLARLAIEEDGDGKPGGPLVDVPLYENPPVSLYEWRKYGWDGSRAVPQFFQERGVGLPPKSIESQLQLGGKVASESLEPKKGNRLLRACDIIVHQPRSALTSHIDIHPEGMLTGMTNVTQTLGLREADTGDRLMLRGGTFEEPTQARLDAKAGADLLADNYEEKTWDELLISTVWLLSPPDAELDAQPDGRWQAFVSHAQFWNLAWAQPRLEAVFTSDIFGALLATVSLLAGGAGLGAANYLAASINDATQSAFNILTSHSMAGNFWTPTGCGTTSKDPRARAEAAVALSLDKAKNAQAKAKAARAKRTASLDPAWPYEGRRKG